MDIYGASGPNRCEPVTENSCLAVRKAAPAWREGTGIRGNFGATGATESDRDEEPENSAVKPEMSTLASA
jgi:hypothetical protein